MPTTACATCARLVLTIIFVLTGLQTAQSTKLENPVYREVLDAVGRHGFITRASYPECVRRGPTIKDRIRTCYAAVEAAQDEPLSKAQSALVRIVVYELLNRKQEIRALLQSEREALRDSLDYHVMAVRFAMTERSAFGKRDQAETIRYHFAEAQRITGGDLRFTVLKASEAMTDGRYGEAKELFTKVIEGEPGHAYALVERAQIQLFSKQYAAAMADLDDAIKADGNQLRARFLRGKVLNSTGQFEQAVEDFDVILQAKPHHQIAMTGRATALFFAGHKHAALGDLNTLLNTDRTKLVYSFSGPDRAALLLKRALILRDLGKDEPAAEDIVRSLRIGGRQNILRVQVFLRRRGFMDVKINGRVSLPLKKAVRKCFATEACISELHQKL